MKNIRNSNDMEKTENEIKIKSDFSLIFKNNKGITLIALVITIVVLIILAGISINLILGDNGLIRKAQESQEASNVARISEKLELEKINVGVYNNNIVNIDKYLEEIEKKGIIDNSDITKIDVLQSMIIVEGKYNYLLKQEENGNLQIIYKGTPDTITPVILNLG